MKIMKQLKIGLDNLTSVLSSMISELVFILSFMVTKVIFLINKTGIIGYGLLSLILVMWIIS